MRIYHLAFLFVFMMVGCSDRVSSGAEATPGYPSSSSLSATITPSSFGELFLTSTLAKPTTPLTSTIIATQTQQPSTFQPSSSPTSTPTFQLCSPIAGFPYRDLPRIISVGYNPPPKGQDDRHEGVDFCFYHWKDMGGIEGKGVQSMLPGRIAAALDGTFPYGSFVLVETTADQIPADIRKALKLELDQSLYTLYAHLQDGSLRVELGQEISSCQVLGLVGRTGNTKAPHLHFETRIGVPGAAFKGMSNFVDNATDEERRNYRLWRISGLYNHFDPMDLLSFGFEETQP